MGRRRSLFGMVLREMESAAKRSAAQQRRQSRRAEGIRSRALEREYVRQERDAERAQKKAERDAERAAIADEKAAQRADWKAEVDEALQRDQDLLRIGNDSPEVEDREQLYEELLEERAYSPADHHPPTLPRETALALHRKHFDVVEQKVLAAEPSLKGHAVAQLVFGVAALAAGVATLVTTIPSASLAAVGAMGGVLIVEAARRSARGAQLGKLKDTLSATANQLVAREQAEALAKLEAEAMRQWEAAVARERASYEEDDRARRAQVKELLSGETGAMASTLADTFPLELSVPCPVEARVVSREEVALELTAPSRSAIPGKEAKLLASGKPSWKDKTLKRRDAEYQTLVAGLALRHASEAMLVLPTVRRVKVSCSTEDVDPATGRSPTRGLLTVSYDYAALAPLQMDGIDPVAALEHFEHDGTLLAKKKRTKGGS